jgi:hypothetical protein
VTVINNPKLLFYLFAVLIILVRPFVVYEMTLEGKIKEPAAINALLQRLIKKKENHAEGFAEASDLIQATEVEIILPLLFVIYLRRKASWLFSFLTSAGSDKEVNTIFQVSPTNDFYQRISRLQI